VRVLVDYGELIKTQAAMAPYDFPPEYPQPTAR
jgi:hypothetical protein